MPFFLTGCSCEALTFHKTHAGPHERCRSSVVREKRRTSLRGCEILFLNPSITYCSLEAIRLASDFNFN